VFDVFKPIADVWQAVIVTNLAAVLNFIYLHFQALPAFASVGAYGLAIVAFTIVIRLLLSPLTQFQLTTSRKSMLEQRKLAPEVADLRKKYKKDPQRFQLEQQKLYQEHGINPFAGMVGCLPLLVQTPILIALYTVFNNFAHHAKVAAQFLFIPNLNDAPNHHVLFMIPGLPYGVPVLAYLVLPLLAAGTTYVQTKMMQMPLPPNPTDQELQTQSMQRMMVYMSPVMIGLFAMNVAAGLGLYYFVSNCVGIVQQYFIVGWGTLLPGRVEHKLASVDLHRAGGLKSGADIGPKSSLLGGTDNVTKNLPKNLPKNGQRNVPQNGSQQSTSQSGLRNGRKGKKRKR
jgi:YidC/Oxa1 family membrane protein insertase